jgi:dihydrodipicolinate synthase/N-acetylneuraminate lyase
VPGLANVAPRVLVDLVRAGHAGDMAECRRLHDQVFDLTRMYTQGIGLPGIYAAAAQLGLIDNVPAEPWLPIDQTQEDEVRSILRAHDLLPIAAAV